jgi:hypothetical protein
MIDLQAWKEYKNELFQEGRGMPKVWKLSSKENPSSYGKWY